MLVTMKEIVDAAREGHYCVPAPNYVDQNQLYAAIAAAEEAKSPLILDIGKFGEYDREEWIDLCTISRRAAERASVPVCINLDHGGSFYDIMTAIHDGCTSVMCDRSYLDYEDNVEQVAEVVKVAHELGITVEAEIGHVGNNVQEGVENTGHNAAIATEEDKRAFYTNPEQAIEYVEKTGVDCLAVAVGTVHGLYPEGFKPSIDLELLAELREKVPVPLVIHGGSGTGDELLSEVGKYASKLNVGSDLFKAFGAALADGAGNPMDPLGAARDAYKEELKHYMTVLGSAGKAA